MDITQHAFFSETHGMGSETQWNGTLGHKMNLNKFERIKIITGVFLPTVQFNWKINTIKGLEILPGKTLFKF